MRPIEIEPTQVDFKIIKAVLFSGYVNRKKKILIPID